MEGPGVVFGQCVYKGTKGGRARDEASSAKSP